MAALKEHRKVLQYVSWGVQRVVASQQYGRDVFPGPRPVEMRAPVLVQKADDHVLYKNVKTGEFKCRSCGASARTPASLDNLRVGGGRKCAPSKVTQALTNEFFKSSCDEWEKPVSDDRVAVALAAAAALEPQGAPVEPERGHSLQRELDEASNGEGDPLIAEFGTLGHDVFRVNSMYCCRRCAGHCSVLQVNSVRKLKRECVGLSDNLSTRRNQLTAIDRISRGLEPRQRGGDSKAPT